MADILESGLVQRCRHRGLYLRHALCGVRAAEFFARAPNRLEQDLFDQCGGFCFCTRRQGSDYKLSE